MKPRCILQPHDTLSGCDDNGAALLRMSCDEPVLVCRFSASDVLHLGPEQQPCVRLDVHASSFLLHQIRHMVGAAVAVATGTLPEAFIPASLSVSAMCSCVDFLCECILRLNCRHGCRLHNTRLLVGASCPCWPACANKCY